MSDEKLLARIEALEAEVTSLRRKLGKTEKWKPTPPSPAFSILGDGSSCLMLSFEDSYRYIDSGNVYATREQAEYDQRIRRKPADLMAAFIREKAPDWQDSGVGTTAYHPILQHDGTWDIAYDAERIPGVPYGPEEVVKKLVQKLNAGLIAGIE